MDKLKQNADPFAALVAAIIGILGALGMLSKWGYTADQLAMMGGFVLSGAAAIRALYNRAKRSKGDGGS